MKSRKHLKRVAENSKDTEKIYEKIIENLAKSYNRPYPWEVRMRILGTTERRTCEIAVKELNLPCTVDEFHRQFVLSCLKNLENVYLFKGIASETNCGKYFYPDFNDKLHYALFG